MGQMFRQLSEKHIQFISEQKIFFVGTATADSHINISPKGMDTLKVLDSSRVAWLNLTGSGNETTAHVQQNPRMTIMFCSFNTDPLILRLYGSATVVHKRDPQWNELIALFDPLPGARQIFDISIDMVQTSCGFGVPFFSYMGERPLLRDWAIKKGEDGLEQYWKEKNQLSIDGIPTHILKQDD